jgi:hypothetical protein
MFKYILKSFWRILSVLLIAAAIFGVILGMFWVLAACTVAQVFWIMVGLGLVSMVACAIVDGRARYLRENTKLKAERVDKIDKCYLQLCSAANGKKVADKAVEEATLTMVAELHNYGRTFGWDDTFHSYVVRLKNVVEPLGLSV